MIYMEAQEQELQRLMSLAEEAAKAKSAFLEAGKLYARRFTTFRVGDRVIVKPKYGMEECAIVQDIRFKDHCDMPGMGLLFVIPYTKNWGEKKMRRNSITIEYKSEIVKHIPK